MWSRMIYVVLALFLSANAATALCRTRPFAFQFDQATPISAVADSDTSSDPGRCLLGFSGGMTVSYSSITPITRPKSGTLEEHSSKLGWIYTPKAGFKGADTVSLRVCGTYEKNTGCTVVNFTITVR
jgi:hypothetical protein